MKSWTDFIIDQTNCLLHISIEWTCIMFDSRNHFGNKRKNLNDNIKIYGTLVARKSQGSFTLNGKFCRAQLLGIVSLLFGCVLLSSSVFDDTISLHLLLLASRSVFFSFWLCAWHNYRDFHFNLNKANGNAFIVTRLNWRPLRPLKISN